jgi:hypothetical protein
MTEACAARITDGELEELVAAIQESTDATLPSRSIENDRALLAGVLTGSSQPRAIHLVLLKEGGDWKVDDVRLEDATTFGQ